MTRFLVVLDVDSTLIENEVIDLLADAAGKHDEVAAVTTAAMRGELDFTESLRQRVSMLEGLSEDALLEVRAKIQVTKGAHELIAGVHAAGGRVAAISGGFYDILDPLAAGLKLDRWRANSLEAANGSLTGRVRGAIIDAEAKARALREWGELYSVPSRRIVAVGDGANDLPMLEASALSIAFDANQPVRDAAHVSMGIRDLSQVLPLLGLRG